MEYKDITTEELQTKLNQLGVKTETVRKNANKVLSELEKLYEEIISIKKELRERNV